MRKHFFLSDRNFKTVTELMRARVNDIHCKMVSMYLTSSLNAVTKLRVSNQVTTDHLDSWFNVVKGVADEIKEQGDTDGSISEGDIEFFILYCERSRILSSLYSLVCQFKIEYELQSFGSSGPREKISTLPPRPKPACMLEEDDASVDESPCGYDSESERDAAPDDHGANAGDTEISVTPADDAAGDVPRQADQEEQQSQ